MKKFYLNDGKDTQGPFNIEELRTKDINKSTPIWYEGLENWIKISEVDELRDLFNSPIPPPFENNKSYPPPVQPMDYTEQLPEKKNNFGIVLQSIGGVAVCLIIILFSINYFGSKSSGSTYETPQTYQEKVMTVEEIERSQPLNFLTADGNYNKNFWGDKIKVHGVIKNNATVATYKDALVKITYYTKTKSELGSKEYRIYETFPPHSEVKFELKIDNFKDVATIGWEVLKANVQ
ncbi:DUF4339 domain-containing protein [Pedobacter arcticus]|uniref:DUF4339 domain-containing protein n=1 Tax=Pedobacter arcticus TaxID=752140 RepID=UPI0002E3DB2F|nr:DUF4339 domain-containing protein [Pedobacter arcticus]